MAPHVGLDKISNTQKLCLLLDMTQHVGLDKISNTFNGFQNFGMNVDKITPLIIEFYHNEDSS